MQPGELFHNPGALLAIDIGADRTGVVLVDRVENTFRFIARAERPSTHRAPIGDALPAVREAIGELERLTGRLLLQGETLMTPQRRDGSGVDAVVASISDIVPLRVLVLADVGGRVAHYATTAIRNVPCALLDTIDPRAADTEQRVAALPHPGADVILVLDPSPADAPRFAAAMASAARNAPARPLAIVCGANNAVYATLEAVDIEYTLPPQASGSAGLESVRALLRRRLRELLPLRMPGLRRLRTIGVAAPGSVVEDRGLMLRFLAAQDKRPIMYAGADGGTTFVLTAGKQSYQQAVDGQLGLRAGAAEVMRRRGAEKIARWLPDAVPLGALRNRIMNRTLRPQLSSIADDDLVLDFALMREALFDIFGSLGTRHTLPTLVIGGGALATCPRPALAALVLLDLLPAARGIVELALDRGMLAVSGALARIDPTAAAALADVGEALATAVLLESRFPIVPTAARVELVPEKGNPVTVDVRHGHIVRLPLARGKRGQLHVRYSGIGPGVGGAELRREVSGSILGIVVDARAGRPALPAAADKRSAALRRWLEALDPAAHEMEEAPGVSTPGKGEEYGRTHLPTLRTGQS